MRARVIEPERVGPKKTRCGVCGIGLDPDVVNYRVREFERDSHGFDQLVKVWFAHADCRDGEPSMGKQ